MLSLYDQHKDDAYDKFAERWPESGDLGQYHAHYVFFFVDEQAARDHAADDSRILMIDPLQVEDLTFDHLESPGYWVSRHPVPANAVIGQISN